jgi:2-polyprenyl-6-hydroxyphenyl methylase/3-demethylubiquinone-9 3-methyltransferase
MDVWIDQPAWIGGYPFKVALGEDVFNLRRDQWFSLPELKACRGELGCNEFVFRKDAI